MADNNEWGLGSGLSLDGAKVEVTAVEFGFNAQLGAGVLCANFTFTNLDTGDEEKQSFSVGKGWDVSRDGSTLVPENPPSDPSRDKKKINDSTNYGILIQSAAALVTNPADINTALWDEHGPRALRHADFWLHSMWGVGTVKKMTTNPSTGAEKESTKYVYTEFLGHSVNSGASSTGTKAKATPKAGATKSAAKAKAGDGIPDGIDAELWEQLVTLAGEADDHDSFLEAALDLDEVDGNKAAQKAVMGTKAGSVWAARTAQ